MRVNSLGYRSSVNDPLCFKIMLVSVKLVSGVMWCFFYSHRHGEAPSEEQTKTFIEVCDSFIRMNPLHKIGNCGNRWWFLETRAVQALRLSWIKLNWILWIVESSIIDDSDLSFSFIGVHCTHGFNRTGFLIVSYLVEKLDWRYSTVTPWLCDPFDERLPLLRDHRELVLK